MLTRRVNFSPISGQFRPSLGSEPSFVLCSTTALRSQVSSFLPQVSLRPTVLRALIRPPARLCVTLRSSALTANSSNVTKDYKANSFCLIFNQGITAAGVIRNLQDYLKRCKFDDYVTAKFSGLTPSSLAETFAACARIYVNYVYEEVLLRRLQSLKTMSELCYEFKADSNFRSDMLSYSQDSRFTEVLKVWAGKSITPVSLMHHNSSFVGVSIIHHRLSEIHFISMGSVAVFGSISTGGIGFFSGFDFLGIIPSCIIGIGFFSFPVAVGIIISSCIFIMR